jgi:PhnB protein
MGAQTSELKDKIMHFYLKSGNISFMGSDMLQGEPPKHGNRVILCLVCDSKEEIEALFAKVSAGGKINRALKEEFFGTYGEAADKFGFYWMFQYSPQKM